ncbi:probable pectinesterase/pectinesterase inhibitor 20 [Juglans regia]|uniref:Pectinesterase n=1 Tax=Juglans regia TaxID=51240 RepID=A0A2I4EZW3_JUGRE|nr:probable pectinesterase/pectinesterase inhibitor 20 [Juglans regia]
MASKLFSPITFSFFILLLIPFFTFISFADISHLTTLVPPETICKSTLYSSYCKSVLPNQTANVFDYGRFAILKSLLQSRIFSSVVNNYVQYRYPFLSKTTIRALEDCQLLASLNVDYLKKSYETINTTSVDLSTLEVDDVQTFLSAILTNQQTCLEGLISTASDSSIKNALSVLLYNDTKLHGVSLALFTKGWVPMKKDCWQPERKYPMFRNGSLPLKMSSQKRAIYESVCKRKIFETDSEDEEIRVSDIVIVCQDGGGNFTTINDAILAAPNNTNSSDGYFLIYVTAGVYQEYVSIPKNNRYLLMIGDGINRTIITGNRSVDDGWTTFNSATFAVVAPGFVAVDITIRNTAGPTKHQAVALQSGADMTTFYSCSFEGYQDTLYTHSLRQFYRECDIYGTVDFIFGNAAVVLQNCNIYPRLPMTGQFNSITAQGRTDPNQNTGISIHNCTIRAADDLAASDGTSTQTYLGRPWKEYSRTVYMQSLMDSLINPAGWHEWSGSFALSTLYYAEYGNRGRGSETANRVTWPGYHVIDGADAANFTVCSFLLVEDDWLPRTGVPYTRGLV